MALKDINMLTPEEFYEQEKENIKASFSEDWLKSAMCAFTKAYLEYLDSTKPLAQSYSFDIDNGFLLNQDTTPHRCPVCGGNGLVPNGFYNQLGGDWSTTSTAPETCRTCNGSGVIWK